MNVRTTREVYRSDTETNPPGVANISLEVLQAAVQAKETERNGENTSGDLEIFIIRLSGIGSAVVDEKVREIGPNIPRRNRTAAIADYKTTTAPRKDNTAHRNIGVKEEVVWNGKKIDMAKTAARDIPMKGTGINLWAGGRTVAGVETIGMMFRKRGILAPVGLLTDEMVTGTEEGATAVERRICIDFIVRRVTITTTKMETI